MSANGHFLDRLRAGFRHTALGPAVVIWGFGYILVDLIAFLLGRTAPGLSLLASLPMFVLGVGQTVALDRLRKHLKSGVNATRWIVLLTAVAAATAVQALFDVYWLRWLSTSLLPQWQEWALEIDLQRLSTVGIVYLWTFCLALTLLWAARASSAVEASAMRAATAEAAAARAEASQHRAEAAALRLQLNPHFMFNTLNSISSLVVLDRKDQAEEMIGRLCDFLRASLHTDPTADVPLGQEIDTIDAYLGIEEGRFGERLQIEIEVQPGAIDALVPNFILQPLVENAIKHGVSAVRGPSKVRIRAARDGDALVLSVLNTFLDGAEEAARPEDTGAAEEPRTGIGLANIRQRLAACYGDGAKLETGLTKEGFEAVIRLPAAQGCEAPAGTATLKVT